MDLQNKHADFTMKKLLLAFLLLGYLQTFAQQKTFEFFKAADAKHPFTDDYRIFYNAPAQARNVDKSGKPWEAKSIGQLANKRYLLTNKTDSILIIPSSGENTDFQYSPQSITIDENNKKYVRISGYAYINNTYNGREYIITVDETKNIKYLHPKDLNDSDTIANYYYNNYQAIGNNLLIQTSNKFIWGNTTYSHLNFADLSLKIENPNILTDYKTVIYSINNYSYSSSGYIIFAFFSDGTYTRVLKDTKIKSYAYDASSGTLKLYTQKGIFNSNGKIITPFEFTNSQKLLNSSEIQPFKITKGAILLNIIATTKGISIQENNTYRTYLFEGKSDINKDSLQFDTGILYNWQEDSTLVFCYYTPTNPTEDFLYLITYKNGIFNFKKKYDLKKLLITNKSFLTYYVKKEITYLYSFVPYQDNSIYQIIDTIKTPISILGYECNMAGKSPIKATNDYLWVQIYSSSQNPVGCEFARMKHNTYFIRGNVFYDSNTDGIRDANELGYSQATIIALPSGISLYPDKNGHFAFQGEPEKEYVLKVQDSTKFASIKFIKSTNTFGVKLKAENPEIKSSFFLPPSRCNTNRSGSVTINNSGVVPVEKAVLFLVPDDKSQLQQDNNLVDTAKFEFTNLSAGSISTTNYQLKWADAEQTGKTATMKLITRLYSNNTLIKESYDSIQTIIRCSYDPNDKSVTPVGQGDQHLTLKKNKLQYLIRFENTGNDTAYHVVIKDTIHKALDLSTLQIVGSSHTMNTSVSKARIISFNFNDIYLPDTNTNKEKAQGYVLFTISANAGVQDYTQICNNAAIIFDENKPVITNLVCNTLVETMPVVTATSNRSKSEFHIFPNPAHSVVNLPLESEYYIIYNSLGMVVKSGKENKLDVSGLNNGVYTVQLLKDNEINTQKLYINK